MAQFILLYVVLTWLVVGHAREPPQQHVLAGQPDPKPFPQAAEVVREKLKGAGIIPHVIDDFSPSLGLHATWPSKEHALLGNTLKPEKLQDEPSIALHDMHAASSPSNLVAANVTYVVALTDPDAPSHDKPKWAEFCHWIASGTLKPALCDPKQPVPCPPMLTDLNEIMSYKPPAPPKKTGPHRYVFLAFVPSNGTTDKLHLSKPSDRKHWGYDTDKGEIKGVREWADENGLAPVGANFIYALNKKQ
ncbi:PEBP-like protein [Parathielavia appendiculata]|uniref:PEBP-like protein n=1 Tax=Parathielavia appendiculata TaxID=2587402 RepID=A0AAN6TQG2_9PEZI|nr:PEBP-like protein [Parathielavia appendiculata]